MAAIEQVKWVVGRTGSKRGYGASIKMHADAGSGYYILDEQDGSILYAFRRPVSLGPVPHLIDASEHQIKKLEDMRLRREGMN